MFIGEQLGLEWMVQMNNRYLTILSLVRMNAVWIQMHVLRLLNTSVLN